MINWSLVRRLPLLSRFAAIVDRNDELRAEVGELRRRLDRLLADGDSSLLADHRPAEGAGDDGPIPPPLLRYLVAGTDDLPWFLHSGRLGAQALTEALARRGTTLDAHPRILDFGCGCGRVVRHLTTGEGRQIHGTDLSPAAIRWCDRHLGHGRFSVNDLDPPLPFGDGAFDLVYAFSVFTHLDEHRQLAWMRELRRVLIPGGLLVFSVHGERCAAVLSRHERKRFDRGGLVVREAQAAGSNSCGVFHPDRHVREVLARGWEVMDSIPEGALGNPPQDLWVFRAPSEGDAPPPAPPAR